MDYDGHPHTIRPEAEYDGSVPAGDETTPCGLFVVLATRDGSQRRLDSVALAGHGLRVGSVDTIDELREALGQLRPDVAVVDVGLAAGRHAVVLELVRHASTPLIAVSIAEPAARVELLLAGADDCLPSAYTSVELAARVIALGRRTCLDPTQRGRVLRAGPLQLDLRGRRVGVRGSEVPLTAMEFNLLSCFLRHPDEALSREWLLAEVWGYTSGTTETVTVYVRRLRSKIESDPARPVLIQTVWGVGYRFRVEEPPRQP
ncbi:MAG: response regulator transcription factor [Pseudonocardiales bacterium]|nr:response regulator transcription factor [Pseudonocardiales bacterium]